MRRVRREVGVIIESLKSHADSVYTLWNRGAPRSYFCGPKPQKNVPTGYILYPYGKAFYNQGQKRSKWKKRRRSKKEQVKKAQKKKRKAQKKCTRRIISRQMNETAGITSPTNRQNRKSTASTKQTEKANSGRKNATEMKNIEQTKSRLSEHKKQKKCARACTCQKKVLPLQPIWRKNEKDTGQGPSVLVFAAVRGLDVQAFVPHIPLYRSGKYPAWRSCHLCAKPHECVMRRDGHLGYRPQPESVCRACGHIP